MGGDEDAAVEGLRSGACRSVSGLEYAALVRAGCQHMIANKAELNKINVFPIPDGDTGTNMAMAGKGILKGLKRASGERSLAKVAASVAEACVLTAQGNSGTILTFFFGSLSRRCGERCGDARDALDVAEFKAALEDVGAEMMTSVAECKEGTLPSVVMESTKHLDASHLGALVASWAKSAWTATEETPDKLEVDGKFILKGKGVVDSGAKGFAYFLRGAAALAAGGGAGDDAGDADEGKFKVSDTFDASADHGGSEDVALGRYCTEFVLDLDAGVAAADLVKVVEDHGTSIVPLVVEGPRGRTLGKIHIHTHEPGVVFAAARKLSATGALLKEKAEDMSAQVASTQSAYLDEVCAPKGPVKTAILASSLADLPVEVMARLRDAFPETLKVVATLTIVNEECYEDKVDVDSQEVCDWMRLDKDLQVSTSAARSQAYVDALAALLGAHPRLRADLRRRLRRRPGQVERGLGAPHGQRRARVAADDGARHAPQLLPRRHGEPNANSASLL